MQPNVCMIYSADWLAHAEASPEVHYLLIGLAVVHLKPAILQRLDVSFGHDLITILSPKLERKPLALLKCNVNYCEKRFDLL